MSSLPTWVENDLKLLEFLFFAYEMKPYNPKALQPNLNVKQVVNIGHDLKLQKFIIKKKCRIAKIKIEIKPNILRNNSKYKTCKWANIKSKIKIRVVKIRFKTRKKRRVKFEVRPKITTRRNELGIKAMEADITSKGKHMCMVHILSD